MCYCYMLSDEVERTLSEGHLAKMTKVLTGKYKDYLLSTEGQYRTQLMSI